MCGRFSFTMDIDELQEAFPGVDFGLYFGSNYNVAPSQDVLVIPNITDRKAQLFRWGLIPPWSKDLNIGYKMINARAETLAEKPSFRSAYKRQRCLIPASGFYEWRKDASAKTPFYIRMKSRKMFTFAGLWEKWQKSATEPIFSCTIITTEANELLKPIHHRMPVILKPEEYETWLDADEQQTENLNHLLTAYPSDEMETFAVSTHVNSPRNKGPDCIKVQSA